MIAGSCVRARRANDLWYRATCCTMVGQNCSICWLREHAAAVIAFVPAQRSKQLARTVRTSQAIYLPWQAAGSAATLPPMRPDPSLTACAVATSLQWSLSAIDPSCAHQHQRTGAPQPTAPARLPGRTVHAWNQTAGVLIPERSGRKGGNLQNAFAVVCGNVRGLGQRMWACV